MTGRTARPRAVLLAGDSTVAAMPAGETPMTGWGPHLGGPLSVRVTERRLARGLSAAIVPVLNVAKGGATTESHRDEWLWDALLLASQPGDVVVIQFGHNDSRRPHLAAREGYRTNLRRMVEEARGHGLVPVLCTPVQRRHFDGDRLTDVHGDYPDAVRDLATELDVPCIDLTHLTTLLFEEAGPDASRAYMTHVEAGANPLYPDGMADETHFAFEGGLRVAALVAEALAPIVDEPLPGDSHD